VVIFLSIGITLLTFKSFLIIDHPNLLGAILIIGLIGLIDDISAIKPSIKIAILFLAYIFLYVEGFLISSLGVYYGFEFKLNFIIAIIFSAISIVTFTNAFNLIDGLDGLSGLIALIIFLAFLYIGFNNSDRLMLTTSTLFIASLSVFLFYNWHPAKVFLGDSGSLMIGFVISIMAVRSLNYIEPISVLYIASVPIIDFLFVTIRRLYSRTSIFQADKGHSHHIILIYLNGSVKKTVIFIAMFQALLCLFGIIAISKVNDSFFPLILFLIIFIIVYKLLISIKTN